MFLPPAEDSRHSTGRGQPVLPMSRRPITQRYLGGTVLAPSGLIVYSLMTFLV